MSGDGGPGAEVLGSASRIVGDDIFISTIFTRIHTSGVEGGTGGDHNGNRIGDGGDGGVISFHLFFWAPRSPGRDNLAQIARGGTA